MNKTKIILIGGGGHAVACIDVINSCKIYNIIGYIDNKMSLNARYSVPYLGNDNIIDKYVDDHFFLICIGQISYPNTRLRIYDLLVSKSARLAKVISPYSYVSPFAEIGDGSIIMHGVIIQSGTKIGDNCIINDKSLIEHDTIIGNHVHLSTGAILNGNVIVGSQVFIGSGSLIKNGIIIRDKAIIGMGSVVIRNVEDSQKVAGNPANLITK